MTEAPSNETLEAILLRIERKVDKTNGLVAQNKSAINKIKGGLAVVALIIAPLMVYAFQGLISK